MMRQLHFFPIFSSLINKRVQRTFTPNPKATFMYPSGCQKGSNCVAYIWLSTDAHKNAHCKMSSQRSGMLKKLDTMNVQRNKQHDCCILKVQCFPDNPNAYFDWLGDMMIYKSSQSSQSLTDLPLRF